MGRVVADVKMVDNPLMDENIDDLLKETEMKTNEKQIAPQVTKAPQDDSSSDEFIDDDDNDEGTLTVQGTPYSFADIQNNVQLIKQMSEQEKEAYTRYASSLVDDF